MGRSPVIRGYTLSTTVQALPRAATIALVAVFGVVPLAMMSVRAALGADIARLLFDGRHAPLLLRTLGLGLSTAIVTTVIGGLIGYRLGVANWAGKSVCRWLLILPLAIPPYLHAIGWTTLVRPGGTVAALLSGVPGGSLLVAGGLYSFSGAVFVLSLALFPIPMLFAEKALSLAPRALVAAAQVDGAGRWRSFLVARWPFLRTAIASSAMIVFLLAVADLGVPTILKVPVFNFEVFTQLGAFNDTTSAMVLAVPLILIGWIAVVMERRGTLGQDVQADSGDVEALQDASTSQRRLTLATAVVLWFVSLVLPLSAIISTLTPEAMQFAAKVAWTPGLHTLQYSLAAVCATLLGAWSLTSPRVRQRRWLLRLTDFVLAVGFATPGTILALALLAAYDRPQFATWLGPAVLVVAALVVRYLIVACRIIESARRQIPDELTEAAQIDGAGALQTAWHIQLPLLRVPLVAAAVMVFVLATGEIGSTILLYPPGGETLPIALYSIEANSPRSHVAAMAILQLLLCLVPAAIMGFAAALGSWPRQQRRYVS